MNNLRNLNKFLQEMLYLSGLFGDIFKLKKYLILIFANISSGDFVNYF